MSNREKKERVLPYRLLDSGNLKKLEQVGPYRLVRPALNAFWGPTLDASEWESADALFTRDNSGGGKWDFKKRLPDSWLVEYAGFTLKMKPTNFGHLGFFAEQYRNWERFRNGNYKSGLNLFGYSGIGSMAMAAGGAKVCHLDAARGMNEWGQENVLFNPHVPNVIRWITDDVKKFVNREVLSESSIVFDWSGVEDRNRSAQTAGVLPGTQRSGAPLQSGAQLPLPRIFSGGLFPDGQRYFRKYGTYRRGGNDDPRKYRQGAARRYLLLVYP